ncbi:MAG: NAD(P)-dependent oxidoreductase [Pseudomonadota bacterium]
MIIVDTAIAKRLDSGKPIRVGMIGAGYSAKHIAAQIQASFPVIHLCAIANRTPEHAESVYRNAGVNDIDHVASAAQLESVIGKGGHAVTDDPRALFECGPIEAIIETTGEVEYGAWAVLEAIRHGKHTVALNCEMDATVGPLLKAYADAQGVVYSNTDGDEPGVATNLARYVSTIGLEVVGAGNLKGFYDVHRTPETQRGFAEANNQKPHMMTSFVDGTKLSMELTVLANGLGFGVARRGMHGPACEDVRSCIPEFPEGTFQPGQGVVDFLLGASPYTGAFVIGHTEEPMKQDYLKYLKLGGGPLYVFYTPFHLPQLDIPVSVCRAVLLGDTVVAPKGRPYCDAASIAKRDLKAGEILDGIGGFTAYTLIENFATSMAENLLPMGVSEGCKLVRDVAIDQPITYDDVELPAGRQIDSLRREMIERFF